MPPLNVVYLHSHDTGRWVQPYGHAIPTPQIQQLAEEGVLFRQAFAAGPTCSPSRAALFTGRHPHRVGAFGLAHLGWPLPDDTFTLLDLFAAADMHRVLAGFQHLVPWADDDWERLGYDAALSVRNASADARTDAACRYLASVGDRPFFLDLGFIETHRRGEFEHDGHRIAWHHDGHTPRGDARYVLPPPPLPDLPEVRADVADFAESAGVLDRCVGRVIDAIDAAGLADRTVVILTTDHGPPFPKMKCNADDHGLGVMWIMRGPASLGLRGGRVFDALVSHLDVMPTLADMLAVTLDAGGDGRSLLPLLTGQVADAPDAVHDAVFGSLNYHSGPIEAERSVRTPRYRYLRRLATGDRGAHSCDGSISAVTLEAAGWGDTPLPAEALHDLHLDPTGSVNRAADPRYAGARAECRGRLQAWMEASGDPAASGPSGLPIPRPVI